MKKLPLTLICLLSFTTLLFSQTLNTTQNKKDNNTNYQVSIGINAIDNTGEGSPVSNPGDWSFGTPISIGLEARSYYNEDMALLLDFGYNDYFGLHYYSIDAGFKYYLNEWIKSDKFEIAPMAGAGIFNINRTNMSINLGGSVAYWFSDNIGVRIKSFAKIALNNGEDYSISNSHYVHNLEMVFKL